MKHKDILIIDDEQRYADMLGKRLSLRGMVCDICYDGSSAIAVLAEKSFKMIILDLKLPDMYGTQVLREIKKIRPEIEVIILTGHGTEKDRQRCMKLGAREFINKPLDVDRLMEIMAAIGENPV